MNSSLWAVIAVAPALQTQLILSYTREVSLLVLQLRATTLLLEQTLLLQSIVLLAIPFLAILVGSLLLIRAPVALLIVPAIGAVRAIRPVAIALGLLTLFGFSLLLVTLTSLPIIVLLVLLLTVLLLYLLLLGTLLFLTLCPRCRSSQLCCSRRRCSSAGARSLLCTRCWFS